MKRVNISKIISKFKKTLIGDNAHYRLLIAYSGGVDSTLLLKLAKDTLGKENVLAVIAKSETYPADELEKAIQFCKDNNIRHKVIKTNELKNPKFINNPIKRCYFCKKELFSKLITIAKKKRFNYVCDGSNMDDLSDFRPGSLAKKELKIRSPLQEAGLTKADIRNISKKLNLPTWNKPSLACLSSRIPYGTKIKIKTLRQIEKAENYLEKLGFRQLRVRHHGNIARIEVEESALPRALRFKDRISKYFKKIGYSYATLDLRGYRTGSMNELLKEIPHI